MIHRNLFHVEGGLYSSEQSLFYRNRRVCTVVTELGDRQDYNCRRRELYRYRDKLMKYQDDLKNAGFEILDSTPVMSIDIPDNIPNIPKIKIDGGERVVVVDGRQRKKLRTLDEAVKEKRK